MTVAELIAELQEMPRDLDVYLETNCCGCSVLAEDVCASEVHPGEGVTEYDFVAVSG